MIDSFAPINPALIDTPSPEIALSPDGHPGYVDDGGDTRDVMWDMCGAASREFPMSLWIEPKDWADKARDNDKYKTWPINWIDRYTNQTPSHECVYHSLTRSMEGCRNRQRGINFPDGPKKDFRYSESSESGSVWLSPLSGYNEAQPRQWGGSNVRGSVELACRRGLLPDKIQPHDYGFKHTLHGTTGKGCNNQSSGPWVSLQNMPQGWEETAKWFRALEVIFAASVEQAVCLVLHGLFNSVGRDGHSIPWGQLIFEGINLKAAAYPDSYEVTRFDSFSTMKRAWQGSFAIASMTAPDDWQHPAGKAA